MARPRKAEVSAVVAAITADHGTPEEAAEAAIAAYQATQVGRPLYVVGRVVSGIPVVFGSYPTPHQAQKGAEAAAKLDPRSLLVAGSGPALDLRSVPDPPDGWHIYGVVDPSVVEASVRDSRFCPDCRHPMDAHNWPKLGGSGCVVVLGDRRKFEAGARRAGTLDICPCERTK